MKANLIKLASPWMKIVRLPNLFTAPGDSLAGFFIASIFPQTYPATCRKATLLAIVSILLYTFGVLLNDLADRQEDAVMRPERPIPSGKISVKEASVATGFTLAIALIISHLAFPPFAWFVSILLALTITYYNFLAKHKRLQGAIAMGACRGLNTFLGIAVLLNPNALTFQALLTVMTPVIAVTVYIAAVTWMADQEHTTQYIGAIAIVPAIACLVGWLTTAFFLMTFRYRYSTLAIIPFLIVIFLLNEVARKLYGRNVPPQKMQPSIGAYLRPLIFWQLSIVLLPENALSTIFAILLVLGWTCSRKLAKSIPQS